MTMYVTPLEYFTKTSKRVFRKLLKTNYLWKIQTRSKLFLLKFWWHLNSPEQCFAPGLISVHWWLLILLLLVYELLETRINFNRKLNLPVDDLTKIFGIIYLLCYILMKKLGYSWRTCVMSYYLDILKGNIHRINYKNLAELRKYVCVMWRRRGSVPYVTECNKGQGMQRGYGKTGISGA